MLGRVGQFVTDPDRRRVDRYGELYQGFGLRTGNIVKLLSVLNKCSMSPLHKKLAMLYFGATLTEQTMLTLVRNNIILPMGFLLFRNQIQNRTRTVVKFAADGASAKSFMGNSDMQIQADANVKEALAHYTTYMGVVVHTPKNVYVQHDVMAVEYQGGMGAKFWKAEDYRQILTVQDHVPKDIICVAIPYTERSFPNPLDVAGRFYTEYKAGLLTREAFEQLHYSTAYFTSQTYGFRDAARQRSGVDQPNLSRGQQHRNRICWQGMQFNYNPYKSDFSHVRCNTGHWGRNVYVGVAAVREGRKVEQLAEQDYSQYTVM